jgi:hypothetical protein
MTGKRADALARLDVFVGEWVIEARFPGDQPAKEEGPRGRSRFEWDLDRQYGDTISGAWEKRLDGNRDWQHDFALTYRRVG